MLSNGHADRRPDKPTSSSKEFYFAPLLEPSAADTWQALKLWENTDQFSHSFLLPSTCPDNISHYPQPPPLAR